MTQSRSTATHFDYRLIKAVEVHTSLSLNRKAAKPANVVIPIRCVHDISAFHLHVDVGV